jgi:hypothetical protein
LFINTSYWASQLFPLEQHIFSLIKKTLVFFARQNLLDEKVGDVKELWKRLGKLLAGRDLMADSPDYIEYVLDKPSEYEPGTVWCYSRVLKSLRD